jgi:hypothetical protein
VKTLSHVCRPCTTPKLAMGIAHDYGAVWCMEWCPSGCYDTQDVEVPNCRLRRLGLLGAACSDGTVRIFSVCFPSELQDKICDRWDTSLSFQTGHLVLLRL